MGDFSFLAKAAHRVLSRRDVNVLLIETRLHKP